MQTFFSDGRVWIGSAKKGEIPVFSDNWCITFSVTAAKGYDNMKVGEESVHTFSRNDERNGFTQGSNVFVKQDADIVIPTELRGTWLRRGADSETDFDLTRILTVNQMETNHSGGLAWTGIARHVAAARNPNPFMAGEYPSGWNITYSVTAVKDYNGIKEGEKNVRGFYLNAEKNAFTHGGLKDIWIKQEER
jgi:hypothetical protein